MFETQINGSNLKIGQYLNISFKRTLRIPDDGKTYPLPPQLSNFPLYRVEDYKSGVPSKWVEDGGIFFPMYQREALWIHFGAYSNIPLAVKIGIGKINALTGKQWDDPLHKSPQDYIVCPDQPWLDGINAGEGLIRQFVAVPLGKGLTVEGQLTGKEDVGGMQILAYQPRKDIIEEILNRKEDIRYYSNYMVRDMSNLKGVCEGMGFGAGGKMKQKIYTDHNEIEYWDQSEIGKTFVHIVNSDTFKQITGINPPTTPVSAKSYMDAGMPWFDVYDVEKEAISATDELNSIKSISELDNMVDDLPIFSYHHKSIHN